MIAAGEPQEFVPWGREHLTHHPGDVYLPVEVATSLPTALDSSRDLLRALRGVSLRDHPQKEYWCLKENDDGSGEEELYFSGKTVVWSKSSGHGVRQVYKTFTLETPANQVVWGTFNIHTCKPRRIAEFGLERESDESSVLSGICAIYSSTVTMFSKSGQDFIATLPFQVSRTWSIKYGLLFERTASAVDGENQNSKRDDMDYLPVMFSMLHPLDDVTPVIKRTGGPSTSGKLTYCTDPLEEIVFTSISPSLALTFHKNEGVHSVWKLRTTTFEEANSVCSRRISDPQWVTNTPVNNVSNLPTSSNSYSKFTLSGHSPSHSGNSPFKSHSSSRVASPSCIQSRTQSPSVSSLTHMATLSRSQSPLMNSSAPHRYPYTPLTLSCLNNLSPTSPMHNNICEFAEPLAPDICLDHEWTEPSSQTLHEKATKAFLSTDVTGSSYLCYHLKEKQQLRLIKFEESNDSSHWIFGTTNMISAQDAEALPSLNLIITLDLNFSISLYTGLTKISKVHVTNILGLFSELPGISNHQTLSLLGTPRRSSLITSSRPPSALDAKFDEEVHLLSPVPLHIEDSPQSNILLADESSLSSVGSVIGLRDAVKNRVTLETASGIYFRLSLPKITDSTIVTKCLQSLKYVLPRDIFTYIFVKWYSTRNAPGPSDLSCQSELNAFLLCLLGTMGYDTEHIYLGGFFDRELSLSPAAVKKQKTSENGSDEDWSYMLSSTHHHLLWAKHTHCLGLEMNTSHSVLSLNSSNSINTCAILYPYMASVLFALHLVYEDCKLNVLQWNDLLRLSSLLFELASDLQLSLYKDHYWRDFPDQFNRISERMHLSEDDLKTVHFPSFFASPPSICKWLQSALMDGNVSAFPYIPNVTTALHDIILVYSLLTVHEFPEEYSVEKYLQRIVVPGVRFQEDLNVTLRNDVKRSSTNKEAAILLLTKLGISIEDIDTLPLGVALPIRDAILHCRNKPQSDWPLEAYNFIGRQELAALHFAESSKLIPQVSKTKYSGETGKSGVAKEYEDGLDSLDQEVLKLRFSQDHRIYDVYRMLQSSKPVKIVLQQRPEVSDHEFIEEQERHLYSLCIRTMALPVGRGMFTLQTCKPVVTETLPIPKLCLTGRSPPRNTTVDLSHIDVPANMNMWPLFHNGVAAGLRISPNASQIDSTWMVYNKPRSSSNDTPTEHAGFLMALGLNGHLSNLSTMSIHDYLCKGHELTSVGILLGMSAAKRGTMDIAATKMLSIHIEALLPPTSTELDVPAVVQVAAVLGIGLLYQGSAHHHMAEVLLGEIGRPPGPEMEHCVDRESYALAAGLALGLVTLGKGNEVSGLTDLPMADQLYHYMVGGHKRPLTGIHKEKHKSPSYQIREGDAVNVDVTSPGATLALGMMFFNTGSQAIAEWMTAPDTQFLLDMVRPDFLLLRTLSKGMIMWSTVYPSKTWVDSHLPEIVAMHAFKKGQTNSDVDYETMSQAYCNIIAGSCLCLGLKFAGSSNEEAFDTLMQYAKMFLSMSGKPVADQAGKSTIETCLNVVIISLAMVMAGTGDLEVLRICRHLRSRVGQASSYVLYGSHMATHMALGLLFLGGGRFTLSTKPEAIGAMVCAFFPKFPTHSNDNRYHLQAFCHLYVLAVEPRLIIPRHIDLNKPVYTHIQIKFKDTPWYQNVQYTSKAPCLLPELNLLKEVIVSDARYWPIVFDCNKNWQALRNLLFSNGILYVKQKAGCLPYSEDPRGFRSLSAQNFMKDNVHGWNLKNISVSKFSCNPLALNFATCFLQPSAKTEQEKEWQQRMCGLLFECASQEKMEILPACIMLYQTAADLIWKYQNFDMWQIKLLLAYQQWLTRKEPEQREFTLIRPDLSVSIRKIIEKTVKQSIQGYQEYLFRYLCGSWNPSRVPGSLAGFLVFHDIPAANAIELNLSGGTFSLPSLYLQLRHINLSVSSLMAILTVLSADPKFTL